MTAGPVTNGISSLPLEIEKPGRVGQPSPTRGALYKSEPGGGTGFGPGAGDGGRRTLYGRGLGRAAVGPLGGGRAARPGGAGGRTRPRGGLGPSGRGLRGPGPARRGGRLLPAGGGAET